MIIRRKIVTIGNSKGITFSKDMETLLGEDFPKGSFVEIEIKNVIAPAEKLKKTSKDRSVIPP